MPGGHDSGVFSLRDLYAPKSKYLDPINININPTPWYKDLTTWLWIGGVLCTVGLAYTGYKFLTDPTFIETIFSTKSTPTININNPEDPISPDITLTDRVSRSFNSSL